MNVTTLHAEKIKSASEVASLVNSGDTLEFGFTVSKPDLFDVALAEQKKRPFKRCDYSRGIILRAGCGGGM